MAGIDYTIPGQFKGIQIESPMNAMAQAMQLRNMQDTMEANQLSRQQTQEMTRQRNALARLHATPGMDIGSENYLTRVSEVAPLLLPDVASQQLKRLELKEKTQSLDLKQREQEAKNIDLALGEFNRVFNPTLISSADEAETRTRAIYKHPVLGPRAASLIPEDQAIARSRQEFERNPQGYAAAQLGLSGKDIIEANDRRVKELRESAEKSYPAYQLAEFEAGREPLLIDQYVAQRTGGATAAPVLAPTTATASTPAPKMVGGTGEMVTLPDGTKQTPETVKTDKKPPSAFGADVHPLVPTLIAGGNKDMATIVQEGHKASGALRQINDTFKEIERLETEKPKGYEARIKALRDYIKVVSTEGPGTKLNLGGITLSTEKKFGEAFAGKIADSDVKLRDAAEVAPNAAATANRVLSILQSGQVFTGSAANIKLQMAKFLKLGGGSDSEAIANTEVLISSLADTTLGAIRSSGLGSGQGFTDKDREFLERAKAGQITYDAKSLKYLAELAHKAAVVTADKWNKRVKSIPQSAIEGTGISTEPVTVSPLLKSGSRDKTPATNSKGWKLEVDASGNRAYVSPDRKQFEEVK